MVEDFNILPFWPLLVGHMERERRGKGIPLSMPPGYSKGGLEVGGILNC